MKAGSLGKTARSGHGYTQSVFTTIYLNPAAYEESFIAETEHVYEVSQFGLLSIIYQIS